MTKASEYRKEREYRALLRSKERDQAFMQGEVSDLYRDLIRRFQDETFRQLANFSKEGQIDIKEARKAISRLDLERYQELARKYVKDRDFSDRANHEMGLYNVTMRMNRLELFNEIMRLYIINHGGKLEKDLTYHLIEGSIEEFRRQAGILGKAVNEKRIERAAKAIVSEDYQGAHFSDRIWRDTRELSRRVARNIDSVVIQGKNPKEFAKRLLDLSTKDGQKAMKAAERLAFTESSRVWIKTQLTAYRDYGYDQLIVLTEPTACSECSPHDGEVVRVEEAVPGDNIPLWHPRCRCTTAAYYETDLEKGFEDEEEGYNNDIPEELEGFNLDLDVGKQKNHIKGTNEFKQRTKNGIPPSYFDNSLEEVERIGRRLIGTGEIKRDPKNPNLVKEKVLNSSGLKAHVVNNRDGEDVFSDTIVIRYNNKKGWHMYPDYPSEEFKNENNKKI